MQQKLLNTIKEKDFFINQHQEEKMIFLEKIEMLEKENKIMTEKLLKNARSLIGVSVGNIASGDFETKNKEENVGGKDINLNQNNNQNQNNIQNQNLHLINDTMNKGKITNNIIVGPNGSRVLTVKMMKDIINEIYASKAEFDKKCLENKLPRETMEQHMYTFLNQKYGLKTLIIEWATSIVNGIKMYSIEDSDICLFGKVNFNSNT
jgi:hypothetical protein